MTAIKHMLVSRGKRIQTLLEVPERPHPLPGVVMCHGLTNSKTTCPMINEGAQALLSAGCAVLRFDFYGSGESDGQFKDKTLSMMRDNVRDVVDHFMSTDFVRRDSIGVWGRSVGATASVLGAVGKNIKAMVLISPPFFLHGIFYPLYRRQGKKKYTSLKPGGPATGEVKGKMELPNAYFEELKELQNDLARALRDVRGVLIVQGDEDRRVNARNAEAIHEIVGLPKKLHIVPGADHSYGRHEEEVVSLATKWFLDHLS